MIFFYIKNIILGPQGPLYSKWGPRGGPGGPIRPGGIRAGINPGVLGSFKIDLTSKNTPG